MPSKQLADSLVIQGLKSEKEQEKDAMLEYLYERCYDTVAGYILKNKGTRADIKDIFHDGLIAFYMMARQNKLDKEVRVEAYLFTICRNRWTRHLKKQSEQVALSERLHTIPMDPEQMTNLLGEERSELIDKVLKSLGDECYELLVHYYFDRMRFKQIVKVMSYSSEQVAKNKKSACMKKMREKVLNSPYYKNFLKH